MKKAKIVSVVETRRYDNFLYRTYEMSNGVVVTIQLVIRYDGEKVARIYADMPNNLTQSYKNVWDACIAMERIAEKFLHSDYTIAVGM